MFNRQKLILEMIRLAGRPVMKLELMKWAFVLSRESESCGGSAFYEFLPYHYGPYSFSLQRDIDTLVADKCIEATEKSWAILKMPSGCELTPIVHRDVRRILDRFQSQPMNNVIDYVYHKYPAYTVNSKREQLAERKIATPAIYTAGYEGLQVDGFLDLLVQTGIQRLLDVRNNPVARRYGFHKSTLNHLCGLLGIEYMHFPELGIVSADRQNVNSLTAWNMLFDSYEQNTLSTCSSSVDRVCDIMREKPSILICMESEACRCHRSRLAKEVAKRSGLGIKHLEG